MELKEVILPSYPSNLLNKDWSKRKCYKRFGDPELNVKQHEMEVRDNDVWIVTQPKSGTTWMQELTWLVMHDYDFETAKAVPLELRSPFLEWSHSLNGKVGDKTVDELESPRLIKSHLPLPLLPKQLWEKKPKTIYVFRNPKDAWVSLYYHGLSLGYINEKSLDDFLKEYLNEDIHMELPFEHVTEFYQLRHEPWLYYTSFERMKMGLREVVLDICQFLNKEINEEQMQKMLIHLSFEKMKSNPMTHHLLEFEQVRKECQQFQHHDFVRRGVVNGYKDELSAESIATADAFIQQKLNEHNVSLEELLLLN